jgi:subtilase family serine protease
MFRIVFAVVSVIVVAAVVLATVRLTNAAAPPSTSGGTDAASSPLSTTKCLSVIKLACYTPEQYRVAYDLNPLYSGKATGKPVTGAGETIVFLERTGSPTISNDLRTFDAQLGLPNPTLTIDKFGYIPPFNPNDPSEVSSAESTTLAVEYAHAIAPGAKIVVAETDAAIGEPGFAKLMNEAESLINRGVGDVMMLSAFSGAENAFPGASSGNYSSILDQRYALNDAYAHHVTMIIGSGDAGSTNYKSANPPYPLYKYQAVGWPASDPLVTSVGGTGLNLNNSGTRLSPDVTWSNAYGASGGGESVVFPRPAYQNGVAAVVGAQRGIPDISLSAQPGCWGYYSFRGAGGTGWHIFGGTNEAAVMMTGIVALADQVAGHPLGLINPALYKLGGLHEAGAQGTGIVDVTSGRNTFGGVKGYPAGTGYNLATGWGSIDAAQFVPALARLAPTQTASSLGHAACLSPCTPHR